MSASHMVIIANRIQTLISELITAVSNEAELANYAGVSRTSQLPYVVVRRRRAGRGREDDLMRIDEGITIVPMEPKRTHGTNERDGVGYRFLVALVQGTFTDTVSEDWPLPIWEQAIRQRFHNKRLGNLCLTDGCEIRTAVEPGELPNWAKLADSMEASYLIVTEYVREDRRA